MYITAATGRQPNYSKQINNINGLCVVHVIADSLLCAEFLLFLFIHLFIHSFFRLIIIVASINLRTTPPSLFLLSKSVLHGGA